MLNGLWLGFFLVVVASALACRLIDGDATMFAATMESLFVMTKLAVEVMVLLLGTLALRLSFPRIAEKASLVECLTVLLGPLFRWPTPEVPLGHPAIGLVTLNSAANGLDLDSAAMPIGLKTMKALQELSPSNTTASNAQIPFSVLSASSLTLPPVIIFMHHAQQGAADPTLVFLPIPLATNASTLAGPLSVVLTQRLCLRDPVVPAYLIPGALLLIGFTTVLGTFSATALAQLSSLLGNLMLFSLTVLLLIVGVLKKVSVHGSLVEGVKEGFDVVRNLLLYLAAMLCAVGVLRTSGALKVVLDGIRWTVEGLGWDGRFVEVLPIAPVKPFSGSAAWAMLLKTMQTHGIGSFLALVAATVQGSAETTFYVLAVYFGLAGLQRACHAVGCALTAGLARVIVSIGVCYWFFA